jgi:hypothetical protein
VEIVGRVLSITIVAAETSDGGPADVPVIEFAFNCRINVPSEQLVMLTVYEVPDPDKVGVLQLELPPNLKSEPAKSDTD